MPYHNDYIRMYPTPMLTFKVTKWHNFHYFGCHQMLTSQMGIVTPDGCVPMATAFLRPKSAVATTV